MEVCFFLKKKCFKTLKLSPKCFENKKISVGRIIPPFFFESSESDRVFIYLHDSNSIFRAPGIKSEWVWNRTVCLAATLGAEKLQP